MAKQGPKKAIQGGITAPGNPGRRLSKQEKNTIGAGKTKGPEDLLPPVFVLAGGQSKRMGQDKASVRIGSETCVQILSKHLRQGGFRLRIIRNDDQGNRGPVSGIATACQRAPNAVWLFIVACDMPQVTPELLLWMHGQRSMGDAGLFIGLGKGGGFPCLVKREPALLRSHEILKRGDYSLQKLIEQVNGRILTPPSRLTPQLAHFNTPKEWNRLLRQLAKE